MAGPPTLSAPSSNWTFKTHWPLLAAALLLSLVWVLPIALGYFGIVDPGLVYRASPAERSSTPWAEQTAADIDTITLFSKILGGGVIVIGVGGLVLAWWPMVLGRTWVIAASLVATLAVLAIAAYFHTNGYWNVWPLGVVVGAWVLGAVTATWWLVARARAEKAATNAVA